MGIAKKLKAWDSRASDRAKRGESTLGCAHGWGWGGVGPGTGNIAGREDSGIREISTKRK